MARRTIIIVTGLTALAALSGFLALHPKPTEAQPIAVARSTTPVPSPVTGRSPAGVPAAPAPAKPAMNPDPKHRTGDLIEISIAKQTLTAWRDGTVAMRLIVSTGQKGYETPTGHYKVYYKTTMGWSNKWKVWMPWAMAWNGNYMIHQLPHYPGAEDRPIGRSTLGEPASHGCIRVNTGDAERLYRWTSIGTPVWVH